MIAKPNTSKATVRRGFEMKTEIILFDSESYDPHKHKKYYLPAKQRSRSSLLVWAIGLIFGVIAGAFFLITNGY